MGMGRASMVLGLCVLVAQSSRAALDLSSVGSYSQSFDSIGGGLPDGWTVRENATSSSLGTSLTFDSTTTPWTNTAGRFKNHASVTGLTSGTGTTVQNNATDRALGVKQTASFGDPGAAFTLEISDTAGYQDFSLAFQSEIGDDNARTTTWHVEWALGSSPTSFNSLGSFAQSGFGEQARQYTLPAAVNDQSQTLWLRVVTLALSSGANNRDAFSIDDFTLTYSAVPEPGAVVFGSLICVLGGLVYGVRRLAARRAVAS